MPPDSGPPPALHRHALGLWFCGIALLGGMRFLMKYRALAGQAPPPDVWLWLTGSCVCGLVGVALIVRAWRRPE